MIAHQFVQPDGAYEVAFVRTGPVNAVSYLFASTDEQLPSHRLTVYLIEGTHVFLLGGVAEELSKLIDNHTNAELAVLLDGIHPRLLAALRRELGLTQPGKQAHGGRRPGAGRSPSSESK